MNWLSPMLKSITPERIESILRGSMGGDISAQWELFDLMEDTWPRLLTNLNKVKRAVSKMDFKVEAWAEEESAPSSEADERAKFVSRCIWKMRPDPAAADNAFERTVFDILDAWGKGVSVLEVIWDHAEDGIVPKATSWVHPGHYAFGDDGRLGLLAGGATNSNAFFSSNVFTGRNKTQVAPFPENKFLIAINRAKSGHPSQGALLRPLAWWWCAANFSAEWLLNFGQIFGLPIRWATYDPNQPGLLTKISEMLEDMGSTAWAAFPAGTTFELKEASKSGGGSDTPQGNMLDRADKQCDLLILGQTLTSDVGDKGSGSRALGEVHEGVFKDVVFAAADFVAQVINQQLVPAILTLNYGDEAEAPEFYPCEPQKPEDPKAKAERHQILANMGMRIPEDWLHEQHDVPLPAKGEPILMLPQKQTEDSTTEGTEKAKVKASARLRANRAAEHRHDVLDAATEKLLENLTGVQAVWLERIRPYYETLILKAQNCADEAEFEAMLVDVIAKSERNFPELFARLNTDYLAEQLEGALGAACVNGAVAGYLKRGGPARSRAEARRSMGERAHIINATPGVGGTR